MNDILGEPKYRRCCTCEFWVTHQDRKCPNCGTPEPRVDRVETLTMEPPLTDGTRAAFGGFLGALLGGSLMSEMGVAVGVAVGVSLGVLLGADREWPGIDAAAAALIGRRAVPCLKQTEETIQTRLADISLREKRLYEALQRVQREIEAGANSVESDSETTTARWDHVLNALDRAQAILVRQRDRYHAKLWEITLVRWQNSLEPLASDWDHLTHDDCNHRLRMLGLAMERGAAYLRDWEGVDLTDLPDGERCVKRLRRALDACVQLKEALIVQQAALAVRGIAPVDEALTDAQFSGVADMRSLDAFNARASLGEFSNAFSELEAEYNRLRSDEELAEGVLRVQRVR